MEIANKCQQFYHKPAGKMACFAVTALLMLVLLMITYGQFEPIWQNKRQVEQSQASKVSDLETVSSIKLSRSLAKQHLFGQAPEIKGSVVLASDIKILGIFLANDPKLSSAVLAIETYPEANYWPGDALPDGGKINAVYADRVIITQNGQRKIVLFDMDSFGDASAVGGRSSRAVSGASARESRTSGRGVVRARDYHRPETLMGGAAAEAARRRAIDAARQRSAGSNNDDMENNFPARSWPGFMQHRED